MNFSSYISKEDLIINNVHHSLTDDDLAYPQKNHLSFLNDNLGQSSFSGWSPSPIFTSISDAYNQNMIPLIPYQNFNPINQNLVTTQNLPNLPVYNSLVPEIPSNYSFMNIDSYYKTDTFEELIANSTPFSTKPKGLDSVKVTTKEIINPRQDRVMINTDQKKNFSVVERSNPLKKSKEKWSPDEDKKLKDEVKSYGDQKWTLIAEHFEGRVGKQCRERWHNHLRFDFKRGPWSEEENQILIEAHRAAGNKWSEISLKLPRRSENAIKNHWNTTKRQMLSKNPLHDSILENYIRSVTINNDSLKDISDGNMNLSLDVTAQTDKPSINASTSSGYVPEPTMFSWDDYFTKVCESVDFEMFMDGWE